MEVFEGIHFAETRRLLRRLTQRRRCRHIERHPQRHSRSSPTNRTVLQTSRRRRTVRRRRCSGSADECCRKHRRRRRRRCRLRRCATSSRSTKAVDRGPSFSLNCRHATPSTPASSPGVRPAIRPDCRLVKKVLKFPEYVANIKAHLHWLFQLKPHRSAALHQVNTLPSSERFGYKKNWKFSIS